MTTRNQQLIDAASRSVSNKQLGEQFGISAERVRQVLASHGVKKPKKATSRECKRVRCKKIVVGTKQYGGANLLYCTKHRSTRRKQ
jgi:hypothetical protein